MHRTSSSRPTVDTGSIVQLTGLAERARTARYDGVHGQGAFTVITTANVKGRPEVHQNGNGLGNRLRRA